jgi:hypothetical protein
MRPVLLTAAVALVRAWTRVYTAGLPAATRDRRMAEIESDLWELEAEDERPGSLHPALHVIARCLIGVPDDLLWRLEDPDARRKPARAAVAMTALAALLGAIWIVTALGGTGVPRVAAAPLQWRRPVPAPPPPPPPPPPPCAHWNPRTGCSR